MGNCLSSQHQRVTEVGSFAAPQKSKTSAAVGAANGKAIAQAAASNVPLKIALISSGKSTDPSKQRKKSTNPISPKRDEDALNQTLPLTPVSLLSSSQQPPSGRHRHDTGTDASTITADGLRNGVGENRAVIAGCGLGNHHVLH